MARGRIKKVDKPKSLHDYVEEIKEEMDKLQGVSILDHTIYNRGEAFTLISLACQLYNADHLSQNVNATMTIQEKEQENDNN